MKILVLAAIVSFLAVGAKADTIYDYTLTSSNRGTWTWQLSEVPDFSSVGNCGFCAPGSVPIIPNPSDVLVSWNGGTPFQTDMGFVGNYGLSFECDPFWACSWDLIEGVNFMASSFLVEGSTLFTGTFTYDEPPSLADAAGTEFSLSVRTVNAPETSTSAFLLLGLLLGLPMLSRRPARRP